MKKIILLYPYKQEWHNIHNSTIELLKKNYNLIYEPPKNKRITFYTKLHRNFIALWIYHKIIRPFISVNSLKSIFLKKEDLPECDLIICSNTLPPTIEKRFIVDLETVSALSGYDINRLDREKVERFFSHENCKAIICWNEICKKSLIETINCSKFIDRVNVLNFGINPEKIKKDLKNEKINLLFVSSINNPLDFEKKGGIIALEAYALLTRKYPNLKFTIRAHVPKWVNEKYNSLNGLRIINKFISDSELKRLMEETDMLFEPLPGINLTLECMSFAIPMIAMDFWAIPEMIKNEKGGLIINSEEIFGKRIPIGKYMKEMNINYLKLFKKSPSKEMIGRFANAAEKLIINPKLREKMSKFSASLVKDGAEYSLKRRNKRLKKIIDGALLIESRNI